ncbi:MAG: hypothetical protein NTU84_05720, partial [Verrucomicrobia bacterium]|nr:hypothetical protein [Verrucomicrobiota bacterium]
PTKSTKLSIYKDSKTIDVQSSLRASLKKAGIVAGTKSIDTRNAADRYQDSQHQARRQASQAR